jgi:phosphinothricin acetyltransferase
MEISIRTAERKDVSGILDIVNYEIKHSTVLYDYHERSYDYQLAWFEQKAKDKMPVITAENKGRVVGFGTYGIFRPWEAYQFSIEHSIYIEKDWRNGGIGTMIMERLIELAKRANYHTMIAGVDASNLRSYHFHKGFGFIEIGTFREVGYKFDAWLDLTFMQLFLDGRPRTF